jgi:hypothetical protein
MEVRMTTVGRVIRAAGLALACAAALLLAPASAVAVPATGPTITTTAQATTVVIFTQDLQDTAHVTSDGVTAATTGSVRFRIYGPNDANCSGPVDFTSTNPVDANGLATSGTTTPPVGGTYQWVADYLATDGTTVLASSPCNSLNESTLHIPNPFSICLTVPELCGPVSTISTTAQPGPMAPFGAKLSDKAAVTVGFASGQSPAIIGTVTFKLYGPDDPNCNGTPVYTDADKPVSSGLASSGEFTTTRAGEYHWVANYSGGGGMPAVSGSCGDASETTLVAKAAPSLANSVRDAATDSPWAGTQTTGAKAYNSAVLTDTVSGLTPSGTVTYNLYSSGDCSGSPTSEQVSLTNTGSVPRSAATAALGAGSYGYRATYSGDPNYDPATSPCTDFGVGVAVAAPETPATSETPETTIGHLPTNPKRDRTHFRFRSSISGSTFTCQLDDAQPQPCSSPQVYRRLQPGRHVFTVFATSPEGVSDPTPAKAHFRIVAPT